MNPPFNGDIQPKGKHAHHGFKWDEDWKDFFFFITVRHPYPRMYSLWRMMCNELQKNLDGEWSHPTLGAWLKHHFKSPPTLDQFMAHRKFKHAFETIWRCSWQLEQLPKSVHGTVIRLERYYDDLKKVPQLQGVDVGHVNQRTDDWPRWSEVLTDKHCEKIQELWGEDFVRFNYNRKRKAVITLGR